MFETTDLTVFENEPRIRDIILGKRAGMAIPRSIRRVIENNLDDLKRYGPLCAQNTMVLLGSGAQRGIKEYWLNEGQAIRLCSLLKSEKAQELTYGVITVFIEWKRGNVAQRVIKDKDWYEDREKGKVSREGYTDKFKELGAYGWDYARATDAGYKEYLNGTKSQIVKVRRLKERNFRDQLPRHEVAGISAYEAQTSRHTEMFKVESKEEFIELTKINAECQKGAEIEALKRAKLFLGK